MNSLAWQLMQVIALLVQVVFLTTISLNLLSFYKAGKLGKHLDSGIGLLYAIYLINFTVHVSMLLLVRPMFDETALLSAFSKHGAGNALIGLILAYSSNAAKKKLLSI